MLKKVFLAGALLAPALAYGASPSTDLSVQIVPAASTTPPPPSPPPPPSSNGIVCQFGPNYSGSVPAPAQAAGFTTCAFNADFTTSAFASISSWLDCAGASSPLWGVDSSNTSCNRVTMANDGGTQVLHLQWQPGDPNPPGSTQIGTLIGGPGSSTGVTFPIGKYLETRARVATTGSGNYSDIWSYHNGQAVIETDVVEMSTGAGGGSNSLAPCPPGTSGVCYFSAYSASVDPTQYHTYGVLVTTDGNNNIAANYYVDGVYVGDGYGEQQLTANVSGQPATNTNRNELIMSSCFNGGCTATNDLYVQYYRAWECSGWYDGGTANDANHQCNGAVIVGQ